MGFKCGIVGLPNVGKSTLFNALTASKNAEAANFPFCTIDPNIGIVDVIDENKLVISCGIGCLLLEDYSITPELSKEDEKIYFKIGNKLN